MIEAERWGARYPWARRGPLWEGMEVAQFLHIWGEWEQVDGGWSWGSGGVKTGVGKVNQGQQERRVERRGSGR